MTAVPLPEPTRAYLSDAALAAVWAAVRARLERNGVQPVGTVTVEVDDRAADRLSGLLGGRNRRFTRGVVRVRLADLDAALRASAAQRGLVAVIEQLGGPVVDRRAARDEVRAARADADAALDAALATAGCADAEWVPGFVEGVRRSGLLTRVGESTPTVVAAAGRVLGLLVGSGNLPDGPGAGPGRAPDAALGRWWELAELASLGVGDAHGLDSGRAEALLVLRAAAAAVGAPVPETATQRRELWARVGVTPDQVSGTVLVWGWRPAGAGRWAAMMAERADLGLVTHLTLHELQTAAGGADWSVPEGGWVSVCENPQVLQAAARGGVDAPLVCTSGNPAGAGWWLLSTWARAGVRLRYHGDFDWAGVAIAGRVLGLGVEPWRMGAGDYRAAVEQVPVQARVALSGVPVQTPWDPALSVAMDRVRVAVHEEALLPELLADLGESAAAVSVNE